MEDKTEAILSEILDELRLLTVQTKGVAMQRFRKEFLSSELREKMYEAFDGERTLPEISKDLDCKVNTLQIFAQLLIEKDLVEYFTKGNSRVLKKSISKIAVYYANKDLEES